MKVALRPTDRVLLLDRILRTEVGDGLNEVITQMLEAGQGGRPIAAKLTEWTGVPVSHRSVARWIAEARADAEAAA
jgi:hypothetical protein